MGQKTEGTNSFAGGLVSDLNAISTPPNILTDCLNGTMLTFNGNELVLQNDMGNTTINDAKLTEGFIPIGVKENGGIIYIVSYNPTLNGGTTEIGSFPGPDFQDVNPSPNPISNDINIITLDNEGTILENNLGKILPLTVKQLNPGDPFIICLTSTNNFNDTLTSSVDNRKFYNPRLINTINNRDITSLFKIQKDITDNKIGRAHV